LYRIEYGGLTGTLCRLENTGIPNWQKFCEASRNFVYEDFHCHYPLVYLICTLLADCPGHVDPISISMAIVITF